MPHFYFDTRSGDDVLVDDLGHEFASLEDARQTAIIALLDMAREKAAKPGRRLELAIDVRGNTKVLLHTRISIEVSQAVTTAESPAQMPRTPGSSSPEPHRIADRPPAGWMLAGDRPKRVMSPC